MLDNCNIVTFGPSDWWASNPSCCTHIMRKMAARNRIIYVNPISSDLLGTHSSRGFCNRVFRKLKSLLKFFRKVEDNIYVLSPVFLPIQGIWFFDVLNNLLVKLQLIIVMMLLRFKKPLLWVENIRAADFLCLLAWKMIVYHVSDRFDECPYTKNKDKLKRREKLVSEKSDLLICVSKELFDDKVRGDNRVIYLPHGVDFDEFHNASKKERPFDPVGKKYKAVAGYFGTLTAQNDIELLEYCAKKLKDVEFIFAGQITAGNYNVLKNLPNVKFVGRVPYHKIPDLCASFDICLLPWKMNKWIENCNPLKLKEYMSSGKPIVSVPIREVTENYSDLIGVANSKESFCDMIDWELNNDNEKRQQDRIRIASEHSWDRHVSIIESEIKNILEPEV